MSRTVPASRHRRRADAGRRATWTAHTATTYQSSHRHLPRGRASHGTPQGARSARSTATRRIIGHRPPCHAAVTVSRVCVCVTG
eukprot:1572526-Prymnesium_polylepis.1